MIKSRGCSYVNILEDMLNSWKKENMGMHIVHHVRKIEDILKEVDYDVSKVNKEVLEAIRKQRNWAERYKWPITAWNSFCAYGIKERPDIFKEENMVQKVKTIIKYELPVPLKEEILKILDGHYVSSTAAKLKEDSQEKMVASFEAFYNYILINEPERKILKLEDINEKDVLNYKDHLMTTGGSPSTGQKISLSVLTRYISCLKRIYQMGYEQRKISNDVLKNIKVKHYKAAKREFCLNKERIENLRAIDDNKLKQMNIAEQFQYVRASVMISLHYEAAMRASECVNISWQDIPKYERSKTNVGPVIIRGAKARPENHEDRVYILCDRLDSDLAKWKTVSEAYCKIKNIRPPEKMVNGKVYYPIFFSTQGKIIKPETYISSIFSERADEAEIILPAGYKSHVIRHSRITHWIDEGYAFDKVHENARHSDLSMTWRYFHSSAQKRIEAVERIEKLDAESRKLKISTLPPKGALRSMIQEMYEYLKNNKAILYSEGIGTVNMMEIEKKIAERCEDYTANQSYYTFRDIIDKWKLGRTQTYERIKILIKEGLINPVLSKSGKQRYLKEEIDYLSTLVDSRKASIAFGYQEKVPTTIPGLANKGIIKSRKIGKLHHFEPCELVEHFYDKNSPKVVSPIH